MLMFMHELYYVKNEYKRNIYNMYMKNEKKRNQLKIKED